MSSLKKKNNIRESVSARESVRRWISLHRTFVGISWSSRNISSYYLFDTFVTRTSNLESKLTFVLDKSKELWNSSHTVPIDFAQRNIILRKKETLKKMPEEVKSGELILSEQEKQQRIDELRRLIEGKVFVQRKETSSTFDTYIEQWNRD